MKAPKTKALNIPQRVLLGPGPSMVPSRVMSAMTAPTIGHLDPVFLPIIADVQDLLRYTFQTKNRLTIPISGTGSAGMEASLCNFIEPGDEVLIGINGYFGERLYEMVKRYGANADRIDRPWGEILPAADFEAALSKKKYKLLAVVHVETSTGVHQPDIASIAEIAHRHGALFVLDTVASLGGVPVKVDEWDLDVVYSGSQKCLSSPPGLAPITIGPRAEKVLEERTTPVANWYLDLKSLLTYWGEPHSYHHTAPVNSIFALREALRVVAEEGLEDRFTRHRDNAELLWAGLGSLGMDLLIPEEFRSPTLTTPLIPDTVEDMDVRRHLLEEHNIEIAGGFGPLGGKVWRIGLMGHSSSEQNVKLLLSALGEVIKI